VIKKKNMDQLKKTQSKANGERRGKLAARGKKVRGLPMEGHIDGRGVKVVKKRGLPKKGFKKGEEKQKPGDGEAPGNTTQQRKGRPGTRSPARQGGQTCPLGKGEK